jgi:hypothetical protein
MCRLGVQNTGRQADRHAFKNLVSSKVCRFAARRRAPPHSRRACYHPDTPARVCGRARGSLARCVVSQALNLDDVAFFLW